MSLIDRVSAVVWPAEKHVGGIHRMVRYVVAPPLVVFGVVAVAGLVPFSGSSNALALGAASLFAGVVSFLEAHTQKCPGYAAMGINTCELSGGGNTTANRKTHEPVPVEDSSNTQP